jgi:hypothetical protein
LFLQAYERIAEIARVGARVDSISFNKDVNREGSQISPRIIAQKDHVEASSESGRA